MNRRLVVFGCALIGLAGIALAWSALVNNPKGIWLVSPFSLRPATAPANRPPQGARVAIIKRMPGIAKDALDGAEDADVPVTFGTAYQVFAVIIGKDGGFKQTSSWWEYPLLNSQGKVVTSAKVAQEKGVWRVHDYPYFSGELTTKAVKFSADSTAIRERLTNQGIPMITQWKHIRYDPLDADFLQFGTEEGVYVVPLDSGTNYLKLKKYKAYPAKKVLAMIAEEYSGPLPSPKEADQALNQGLPGIIKDYANGRQGSPSDPKPTRVGAGFQFYVLDWDRAKQIRLKAGTNRWGVLLQTDYDFWEYPLIDAAGKVVSYVSMSKENGVWSVYDTAGELPEEVACFSVNNPRAFQILSAKGLNRVREFKLFSFPNGLWDGCASVYIDTAAGEFVMPLEDLGDLRKLGYEANKIYSAADILTKVLTEYH